MRNEGAERFIKIVEKAKEMGFDPSKITFLNAIHGLASMAEPLGEKKWMFSSI